jgi:glutaminase
LAEKSEARRPFGNNGRKQKIIRKTLNNMWSQIIDCIKQVQDRNQCLLLEEVLRLEFLQNMENLTSRKAILLSVRTLLHANIYTALCLAATYVAVSIAFSKL